MEIDKRRKTVLRTVILVAVVLAAAGIILLIFRLADTKVDTGKGLERLAALEKTDVASVEDPGTGGSGAGGGSPGVFTDSE